MFVKDVSVFIMGKMLKFVSKTGDESVRQGMGLKRMLWTHDEVKMYHDFTAPTSLHDPFDACVKIRRFCIDANWIEFIIIMWRKKKEDILMVYLCNIIQKTSLMYPN